jgi:hypothetical protein
MKQSYKWGALAGLFILIEILAGNKLGFYEDPNLKLVLLIVQSLTLGAGIYLSLRDYKQQNGGLISFGRCMFNGIVISAVAGIVLSVGAYLYFSVLFPAEKEKAIANSEKMMVQDKDPNSSTIAQYEENFIKHYTDTVHTTQADLPAIKTMAADSAKAMRETLEKAKSMFTFGGTIVSNTGPFVILGLLLSLIIAAVIANKKS